MAANGYFVYAGARKQRDLDALNEIEDVQGIRLDVTIQEEIDAAVEIVRAGGRGLYGLVNNAGVAIGGPLTEVDVSELNWLFDVNVYGVYRVTQAFAPLIIEAYTDSLAGEMERFDVQVGVIEPGNYESDISKSAIRRISEKEYAREGSPFADDFKRMLDRPSDRSQYNARDEVAETAQRVPGVFVLPGRADRNVGCGDEPGKGITI